MNWGRLLCALGLMALCAGCDPERIDTSGSAPVSHIVNLPVLSSAPRLQAWGAMQQVVAEGDSLFVGGAGVRVLEVAADHVTYRVTEWRGPR